MRFFTSKVSVCTGMFTEIIALGRQRGIYVLVKSAGQHWENSQTIFVWVSHRLAEAVWIPDTWNYLSREGIFICMIEGNEQRRTSHCSSRSSVTCQEPGLYNHHGSSLGLSLLTCSWAMERASSAQVWLYSTSLPVEGDAGISWLMEVYKEQAHSLFKERIHFCSSAMSVWRCGFRSILRIL